MFNSLPVRLALIPVLATTLVGSAIAQSVSLSFTNTDIPPIPLLDASSVSIDANGNLSAQCVLDGDTCQGITTGQSGTAPLVNFTRSSAAGDITAGGTIGLNWTVQNTAAVCLTSSTPAVTGWNGNTVTASGGTANLTLSTVGNQELSLQCFNSTGANEASSLSANVVQGTGGNPLPTTIPACETPGIMGHELVQPAGFTGHLLTWDQALFGAVFPDGNSYLSPIGSFSLRALAQGTRGPTMTARYLSIPIVAGASANYKFGWLGAQAITQVSYNPPRAADSVFVSFSPCAGDLRPGSVFSSDPWLQPRCRTRASNANLFFGTTGGAGQCPMIAGQTYFINIAMVNLEAGLDTTTTTCAAGQGNRCEANFDGL
jgi:hypothetical protein